MRQAVWPTVTARCEWVGCCNTRAVRRGAVLLATGLTVWLSGCSATGPTATSSASKSTSTEASNSLCIARQITATGGRQGGGFQTAHGDVELKSISPPDCLLSKPPSAISLVNSDGTVLNVEYRAGTVAHPLQLRPGGVVDLEVSWANWCGANPGPLTIHITLPAGGGTIVSSFNGPPDYDFLPGCVSPGEPSTLQFIDYLGNGVSSG